MLESVDLTEIILGAIVAIGAGYQGYLKFRQSKEMTEKEREEWLSKRVDFSEFAMELQEIETDIRGLLDTTVYDRVLILRAWNGPRKPEKVTAVWQSRRPGEPLVKYEDVPLDSDCQERLYRLYSSDETFEVAALPPCLIKSIYEMEGVTHSSWSLAKSMDIDNRPDRLLYFCSASTHTGTSPSPAEVTAFALITDRIGAFVEKFSGRPLS